MISKEYFAELKADEMVLNEKDVKELLRAAEIVSKTNVFKLNLNELKKN
jgi:hypothetical protein